VAAGQLRQVDVLFAEHFEEQRQVGFAQVLLQLPLELQLVRVHLFTRDPFDEFVEEDQLLFVLHVLLAHDADFLGLVTQLLFLVQHNPLHFNLAVRLRQLQVFLEFSFEFGFHCHILILLFIFFVLFGVFVGDGVFGFKVLLQVFVFGAHDCTLHDGVVAVVD